MRKKLKWIFIVVLSLTVGGLSIYYVLRIRTKAYSPEDIVTYVRDGLKLEVFYNRPYKKERVIFGGLVPYGEVWRTGANEATTFETNQDIFIDGSLLKAGKYTLWTIPDKNSWKVIFNSRMYSWGITTDGKPSRKPDYDVLTLELPVNKTFTVTEQFTVYFEEMNELILMMLAWDQTAIAVPIMPVSQGMKVQNGS